MGIGDLTPNDDEAQEESSDSDDPSVSYIYVYEQGRDEIEGWTDDDAAAAAQAYEVTSAGGVLRNQFGSTGVYANIHAAMSDYLAALGTTFENAQYIVPVHAAMPDLLQHLQGALEEDNWADLVDFVLKDDDPDHNADVIRQYLEDNPEVMQRLQQDEPQPAEN